MPLPCRRRDVAMLCAMMLPCVGHAIAKLLPCCCHDTAVILPRCGHDVDDSDSGEEHTPVHKMHMTRAPININLEINRHQVPSDRWCDILRTDALAAGRLVEKDGYKWLRMPLRCGLPILDNSNDRNHIQHTMFDYEDRAGLRHAVTSSTLQGWHMTRLDALPLILMERCRYHGPGQGGLRYGCGSHRGNIGVNFYTSFPTTWFSFSDADWCVLELKVLPVGTHLKGGAKGRYCINMPKDMGTMMDDRQRAPWDIPLCERPVCRLCEILAVLVPFHCPNLPGLVAFA